MEEPILELRGVGKSYGRGALFRDVHLTVRRGMCQALTGRNGAGKTTLLRIAAGLSNASEGRVWRAKDLSTGYVPEHFPMLGLSVRQFIHHMAAIEGLGRAEAEAGMQLFADFFMEDLVDLPMDKLSKGTLQKVAVVQALNKRRDFLILDEPLSGQDEASQRVFIEKIAALKRTGTAVLLSCHEPFLIERLAEETYRVEPEGLARVRVGEAEGPRALLTFEPDREVEFPAGVRAWRKDGCLYASVPRATCDRLIVQMIEKGYSLREMQDEDGV